MIGWIRDSFLHLKNEHGFSLDDLISLFRESELLVPCTLFQQNGSPLSLLIKYLIDIMHLQMKEVPLKIHRSYRAVWGAYQKVKGTPPLATLRGPHYVPLSCFSPSLSIMEAVCTYMKESLAMSNHEIAQELGRDDRTVWTHYHRSQQKRSAS